MLILDTIGELAATFQFASVVFVGGSLVERAKAATTFLSRPFHSQTDRLRSAYGKLPRYRHGSSWNANAAIQVPNTRRTGSRRPIEEILSMMNRYAALLGRNARKVVMDNSGATARVLSFIRVNFKKLDGATGQ